MLGLSRPRGLIVLNGGTTELSLDLSAALHRTLGEGAAQVTVEERLTVITGGTDAGIFSVFGQALGSRRTAPCIGVAPAGRVIWPGSASPTNRKPGEEDPVPLEPHHSHFLLITGEDWGVETEAMLSLTEALSVECASIAILAGGGAGARREVLGHVSAGREVIVLAGTGRLAEDLVGTMAADSAEDREMSDIVATGLLTVIDDSEPPSTLAEVIRARLRIMNRK
jgi:hypothetical protein